MRSRAFLLFFFFLSTTSSIAAQEVKFIYKGFSGNQAIRLNGIAEIAAEGFIRLTNETSRLIGRAFYPLPVRFRNSSDGSVFSFSTAFAFAIIPEYPKLGGHGLAFTIAPSKELRGGLPSQYLGLLNASDVGKSSNHVFAVEFDTVQDFEFGDINDNHVGVDIYDMRSNASAAAAYYDGGVNHYLNLKGGGVVQAWIDYDGFKNLLTVSVSPFSRKPAKPLISFPLDLSPVLLEEMFVGFSSSTGLLASSHYLFGWSFQVNGLAQSLDLSSLPALPHPKKKNPTLTAAACSAAAAFLAAAVTGGVFLYYRIKNADVVEPWEREYGPHRFSYEELKTATRGFRDKDLLGSGGFGKVYRGVLPGGAKTAVAVKKIAHESKQGIREFVAEIATIGRLRHRNLVQLQGWCRRRGDLLLVYDYMPNGSLDGHLFEDPPKGALSWGQRVRIIRDVAAALVYLHEEWESVVIHRDVKASNVLLDEEMGGRLGDFGMAKLHEHGGNASTTRVVGTLGYLAPELTRTGKATTSSDVFAFGALVLEVVCGRRPVEPKAQPEELILVDWVWELWSAGRVAEAVDRRLGGDYAEEEMALVVGIGLMCSYPNPSDRPTMREVVRYLDGGAGLPSLCIPPPDDGGRSPAVFDDFVHSYPSSSFEKVSS
ncbi:concanavalin A-like lectin protein kinase family protein [Wolffia australiana]